MTLFESCADILVFDTIPVVLGKAMLTNTFLYGVWT